jgi:hypothetical protein
MQPTAGRSDAPTAGRSDAPRYFMKTHPLQTTLGPARAAPRVLFTLGG